MNIFLVTKLQIIIFQQGLVVIGEKKRILKRWRKSVNTCDKCKYLYKETWEEKCWDTPAWCKNEKLPLWEFNQKLNNKRLHDWGCTLWEKRKL